MNIEEIREYCITKPVVTEGLPFNDTALVFKVAGKMFALLDLSEDSRGISLKCDPELAIELREQHTEVTPAWHFNKQHWNGVDINGNDTDNIDNWQREGDSADNWAFVGVIDTDGFLSAELRELRGKDWDQVRMALPSIFLDCKSLISGFLPSPVRLC